MPFPTEKSLLSAPLAGVRIVLVVVFAIGFALPLLVARFTTRRAYAFCRKMFFRCAAKIVGLEVVVHGQGEENSKMSCDNLDQCVYIANHVSYLDIFAVGALFDVRFVAKREIRSWPFIGWYTTLFDTFFIHQDVMQFKKQWQNTDREGDSLFGEQSSTSVMFFPEATTSLGVDVLRFKPALFGWALQMGRKKEKGTLVIKPLSLWYSKIDHIKMTTFEREFIGWAGHETLYSHIIRCLGLGRITLEIWVHEPIVVRGNIHRKELAILSREKIVEGMQLLKRIH